MKPTLDNPATIKEVMEKAAEIINMSDFAPLSIPETTEDIINLLRHIDAKLTLIECSSILESKLAELEKIQTKDK